MANRPVPRTIEPAAQLGAVCLMPSFPFIRSMPISGAPKRKSGWRQQLSSPNLFNDMQATVLRARDQFKVADRVVEAITIAMMHLIPLRDRPVAIDPDRPMQIARAAPRPLLLPIIWAGLAQAILAAFESDELRMHDFPSVDKEK